MILITEISNRKIFLVKGKIITENKENEHLKKTKKILIEASTMK